jgi:hypothetical protein
MNTPLFSRAFIPRPDLHNEEHFAPPEELRDSKNDMRLRHTYSGLNFAHSQSPH